MSINTDKAWDKLHARLRDENLLVPEKGKARNISLFGQTLRAAGVVILCVCVGASIMYLYSKKNSEQLLALHNDDPANTLVSTLEDGSTVYLIEGATITYPEQFAGDKRQVSLRGEALFDISGDKSRPFLVETEAALIEVLGTAFNIKSENDKSFELSVQHGLVKVTPKPTRTPLLVKTGETVSFLGDRLQKTASFDHSGFTRYTEKMHFKDERLDNVVKVIDKLSDKYVTLSNKNLTDRRMTVTFVNDTPDDMINLLCLALNLKYSENGDTIRIDKK